MSTSERTRRLAADSEFTFGTVIQRTMDAPLEARMHYGHPDILDCGYRKLR